MMGGVALGGRAALYYGADDIAARSLASREKTPIGKFVKKIVGRATMEEGKDEKECC